MALFSDVKCGKCDRNYSGIHARCPYCGARRGKAGKHASPQSNSTGKLVIGLILLLLLIAAVVVLVITGTQGTKPPAADPAQIEQSDGEMAEKPTLGNDESLTSVEGTEYVPEEQPAEEAEEPEVETPAEPEQEAAPAVTDLKIKCLGTVLSDMTMYVGDVLTMTYEATPEQEDPTVSWSSDNQDVFTILQTGEITGVSAGEAHLTLTVNGVSAECLIRVRSKPA